MGQLLGGRREGEPQLLQPTGYADGPALVAEVPLDLADDRRGRVGGELDAALDVEAVDRLDQADGADLDEVVERLAPAGEPPGEVLDERQVEADQLLAGLTGHRGPSTGVPPSPEQVPSGAPRVALRASMDLVEPVTLAVTLRAACAA